MIVVADIQTPEEDAAPLVADHGSVISLFFMPFKSNTSLLLTPSVIPFILPVNVQNR